MMNHIIRYMRKRGKVSEEITPDSQTSQEIFPFLKLPPEIRNEIYRLSLLTQNNTTFVSNAKRQYKSPGERADQVAVGTIRCRSWRKYTVRYQVAILRVNRQIHREASGIFHLENYWTVVRVNKAGFGQEMKDCGFPVVAASNLWHRVKFPVMRVTVTFPSLESQKQSDTMLVAPFHLRHLIRALWTAKGATEMEMVIHVQPPFTKNTPRERDLLTPFFKLHSVANLVLLGVAKQRYVDELTRAITTTDGIDQTFRELITGVKCLQQYIKAEQWDHAVAQAEKHALLTTDCKLVYGDRIIGLEAGISLNTALIRSRSARQIFVATAMAMAEVTLHLRQYSNTIRFTDRAMALISHPIGFIRFLHPHPHGANAFAPPTIIKYEHETQCFLLVIRARAHMGLRRAALAARDIHLARCFMPDSVALASVSEAWYRAFGPQRASSSSLSSPGVVAEQLLPSPASPSSSLSTAFADAAEDLGG